MSSHPCVKDEYAVCDAQTCDIEFLRYRDDRFKHLCDKWGCAYSPYRLGVKDFYGKGKTVDTARNFTYVGLRFLSAVPCTYLEPSVVTRFEETEVTQFFIQDGKKIETPAPAWDGFPDSSGISAEYCNSQFTIFDDQDRFHQVGGFPRHNEMLKHPMVLTMSITNDVSRLFYSP